MTADHITTEEAERIAKRLERMSPWLGIEVARKQLYEASDALHSLAAERDALANRLWPEHPAHNELVKLRAERDELYEVIEDCWNQFSYDGKAGGLSTLEWIEETLRRRAER